MATYRLKIRTTTSTLPFAYISDPYELANREAYDQEVDLRKLGTLSAICVAVDGELVVINPRHVVSVHRTEVEGSS